jgi:hypothetical protein
MHTHTHAVLVKCHTEVEELSPPVWSVLTSTVGLNKLPWES